MERSTIYELIDVSVMTKWREEAEKDKIAVSEEGERKVKDALLSILPEEGKKLLSNYQWYIQERMDYLHYNLGIKLLNLGVKIGMELQEAFTVEEE